MLKLIEARSKRCRSYIRYNKLVVNTETNEAKDRNTKMEFERKEQETLSQKKTALERSTDRHMLENLLRKVTRTYKLKKLIKIDTTTHQQGTDQSENWNWNKESEKEQGLATSIKDMMRNPKKDEDNRTEKYWKFATWNIKGINEKKVELSCQCNKYNLKIIEKKRNQKKRKEEKQYWEGGND